MGHLTQVNPLMSQYKHYMAQSQINYIPHSWMPLPEAEMWLVLFRKVPEDWCDLVYDDLKRQIFNPYYRNGKWYSFPKRSAIYSHGYRARLQCECKNKNCQQLQ